LIIEPGLLLGRAPLVPPLLGHQGETQRDDDDEHERGHAGPGPFHGIIPTSN